MAGMSPNQPKTPSRNIRVPDDLWEAAKARTTEDGTTVTAVVNAALRAYLGWSERDG